ncbi:ankyrin [Aspergillus neoniger CBS 115656]|uniref:Ankyrin n=1 Tax=Aspergillus neoniger (strain CBS 115656) TaxID=1448310 RepID=A0A318YUX5_ASPNB|nr:ankyrin [Aspergillus neoniger CBS 115656]PYH38635.1 ankyrin [Aspergillus neoniger CBS 115656]
MIPLQAACYNDPWGYIEHHTFTSALQISLDRSWHKVASNLLSEAIHAGYSAENFSEVFHYPCSLGYKRFAVQMLEHFTVINWPDGILVAAEYGRVGAVDVLLSWGADVEARNRCGESAINLAVNQMKMQGDDITDKKFSSGPYLGSGEDTPDYMRTLAALINAGHARRAEMLRYLLPIRATIRPEALFVQPLENKAEEQLTFRGPSKRKFKALDQIVDYTDVLLELSQHDTQVAHLNKEPFREAMQNKHVECVQVFIDLFTNDDRHRADCCTPLLSLTLSHVELLTYFLSQGADQDTRHFETGEQGTALHAAVVQGFHDVAEILLESHADVNTPCTLLGTPLAAIMTQSWKDFRDICHRRCAKLLLEWGADIDSFDERLGTQGALEPENYDVSHSQARLGTGHQGVWNGSYMASEFLLVPSDLEEMVELVPSGIARLL